nr:LysR substrate-binding domain-containing protein [Vibrio crassostreae]
MLKSVGAIQSTVPDKFNFDPLNCTRKFTISALSVFNHTFFPTLSKLVTERAPSCTIEVLPIVTSDVETKMRFEKVYLLIESSSISHSSLKSKVICSDAISVIYSKNHPRLGESISQEEYFSEKHVVHSRDSDTLGYLTEVLNLKEMSRRDVAWSVSNMIDMFPILSSSDMIGIAPRVVADKYCEFFDLQNVTDSFLTEDLNVSMFWHPSKNQDPVHKWFRELCEEAASMI